MKGVSGSQRRENGCNGQVKRDGRIEGKCNGFINLLNLKLNLLNCNRFAMGFPLQPVGHPLQQQRAPFLMTNAVERSILALGMGATGD